MSGGELTGGVDTPKGKKKPKRHPWDWYVEQPWVTDQLIRTLGSEFFDDALIYDPACGRGTILDVFSDWAFPVMGSDIKRRLPADSFHYFAEYDFLTGRDGKIDTITTKEPVLSIVSNFPYSLQGGKLVRGLAAEFCLKALQVATHKVCALLPLKWLAGEKKHGLLTRFPAHSYLVLNERPSMPPGNMIEQLGDKAFKRGKVDYMWVVWDKQVVTLPGETRTIHITPRPKEERV